MSTSPLTSSLFAMDQDANATSGETNVTDSTPLPTPAPELPEGAAPNVTTDDWQDVKVNLFTSMAIGAVLITLFECLRGRRNRGCRCLYRQRHSLRYRKNNCRLKRIDVKPYPRGFLRWIPSTWRVSDAEFYQQVGMDGYVTVRFIKLCKRLCAFAAFFGMLILLPIYEQGSKDSPGVSRLSMANLEQGGSTLWSGVVFAYLFTMYFLYSLRREFLAFSDLRNDWLAGGDVARSTQTAYTVRVERIPRAFRSPAILQKFFSTLFPGQIHSATVCLGLTDLRELTDERAKCLQALERSIIRKEALGICPTVRTSWFGPKEDAIAYYGRRLAEVNQKLRPKQEAKLEAAKNIERFRRKELRNMGASLENMAMYFVEQLDSGGAEDEDGNARMSWLERRKGDRGYTSLDQNPLPTVTERQQHQHEGTDTTGNPANAAGRRWEAMGGRKVGEAAERGAESAQHQQQQQKPQQQRRWSRPSGGGGGGHGAGSQQQRRRSRASNGGGGDGVVEAEDVGGGSLDEERAGGGGGGGNGGIRPRALSPVEEERGKESQRPTLDSGRFRSLKGSTGSIGVERGTSAGRRSSTRNSDRARAHSGGREDGINRGVSWRQLVTRRESNAAAEEQQAVKDAEEVIERDGGKFIRVKVSNLHQTLGAGALGRSVAAPRVSALIHPVMEREGDHGVQPHSCGSSGSNIESLARRRSSSDSSTSSRGFHIGGRDVYNAEGGDDDVSAGFGRIRRGSGGACSLGHVAASAAAGIGLADLDAFGGGGVGGNGGGEGGVMEASPIASPTNSLASSFFSVSSPRRVPGAAAGRRWSSVEDRGGGAGLGVGGGGARNGNSRRLTGSTLGGGITSVGAVPAAVVGRAQGGGGGYGSGAEAEVSDGETKAHSAERIGPAGGTGDVGSDNDLGGVGVVARDLPRRRYSSLSPARRTRRRGGRGRDGDGEGEGSRKTGAVRAEDGAWQAQLQEGQAGEEAEEELEDPLEVLQLPATNVDRWPSSDDDSRGAMANVVAVGELALSAPSPGTTTAGTGAEAAGVAIRAAEPLIVLNDEASPCNDEGAVPMVAAGGGRLGEGTTGAAAASTLAPGKAGGGVGPSEGLLPRSELPRFVDEHDDDAGMDGFRGDRDQGLSTASPAKKHESKVKVNNKGDAASNGYSSLGRRRPSSPEADSGGGVGAGGAFDYGSPHSSRFSSPLSSIASRSDAGLLRGRSGEGNSTAAVEEKERKGMGQEDASPTRAGMDGVRRRGGQREMGRQKGALTQFPALFSRRHRSPTRGQGSPGSDASPTKLSSFALASPKNRRRISPRSRSTASYSFNDISGSASDGGSTTIENRRRPTAPATAMPRVVGESGSAPDERQSLSPMSESSPRSAFDKLLMPKDQGLGAEEMESGIGDGSDVGGDGGGGGRGTGSSRRRKNVRWGKDLLLRPPGETIRDASTAVMASVRKGLESANTGLTKRVGHKLKRGVNEVKDTVKGTVKDLSREVGESVYEVADAVKVLTKAGGMSGTGFVTFKCLSGRACAVSTLVTNRPEVFNLSPAPEPRDIVWKNVTNHVLHVQNRNLLVNAMLFVGIIFWSVVVSSIQALSKVDTIAQVLPFVGKAAEKNAYLKSFLEASLPVIILLIIINQLYFILKWMALHLEGHKTYSEVERAVMSRYFFFQLANVFVTIGAGSIKDAIISIFDAPGELLDVLGETVPKVAVYFLNLITVKVISGLMLELCFGGRPLKFWRILFAETFTDPGLRTKAGKMRGSYEPSEPWYGRFFADFLLVMLTVFTFQVIAPLVAILGLVYFMFAEIIYKFQLLHCYWPLYESGGQFFHKLLQQLIVGAVAGQVTLIGYMSIQVGFKQVVALIPLPLFVLYSSSRWRDVGRRTSNILSLDKAILQDVQDDINVRDGADPVWESFNPTAYLQPSLLPGDPNAEFSSAEAGELRDDSDVDVEGLLELDSKGNVVAGKYGKTAQRRNAGGESTRGINRRRSSIFFSTAFPWLVSSSKEDPRPADADEEAATPRSGRGQETSRRTTQATSPVLGEESSCSSRDARGNRPPDLFMA